MSGRTITRRSGVKARRCRCGADVLEALTGSGQALGLDVVVDTAPLTPAGELAAVLAGVTTYTHHVVAAELHHRSPWTIRTRPAGSRARQTVHALHVCGQRWQAQDPGPPAAAAATDDDAPPY